MDSTVIFGIYEYTNTHIHAITIDEKRDHKFEGVWGGLYDRVWRWGIEDRNVIKIQP